MFLKIYLAVLSNFVLKLKAEIIPVLRSSSDLHKDCPTRGLSSPKLYRLVLK